MSWADLCPSPCKRSQRRSSTHELPDDCKDLADQSQCRSGGEEHALHVVTSPAKTKRTDLFNDEAGDDAGDQKHSERGTSDLSPIDDRK
jgi:hypothetical protein